MKFTRDLTHLLKLFRPTEEPVQPDELLEAVLGVVDVIGWTRWTSLGEVIQDSQAASNGVSWNAAPIETTQLYFVPYAEVSHNDAAASHTLWLELFDGSFGIAVRQPLTVTTGLPVNLIDPPLVFTNRFDLRGRSGDVLPVGTSLFLRHSRLVLQPGEYILK